jgi:hypothetical protein
MAALFASISDELKKYFALLCRVGAEVAQYKK